MTTLYWYKTGVDASWETLTGNWWLDAEHTQQALSYPVNGDSVYILGDYSPSNAPTISLQYLEINNDKGFLGSTVTILSGGTLIARSPGGRINGWQGDASLAGTIEFYGNMTNQGIVGDNAKFYDYSANQGTVGDNAKFYDYSANQGTVGDNAKFYDYSIANYPLSGGSSEVGKNAIFYDYSYASSTTIGDGAVFNGNSCITGGATFGTVTWNSAGYSYFPRCVLNGDWTLLKPLRITYDSGGTGKILIPRREMDILIGTGGAKIVIDQAYGYRCGE